MMSGNDFIPEKESVLGVSFDYYFESKHKDEPYV